MKSPRFLVVLAVVTGVSLAGWAWWSNRPDPEAADRAFNLGKDALNSHDYDRAIDLVSDELRLDPRKHEQGRVLRWRAREYDAKGMQSDAEADRKKALRLLPSDATE